MINWMGGIQRRTVILSSELGLEGYPTQLGGNPAVVSYRQCSSRYIGDRGHVLPTDTAHIPELGVTPP
jgi:hypothetical protein